VVYTLLLRLAGPMQSWGTNSRFAHRDTNKEPSKSGVIGLLAGAMGIDREDWHRLEPLTCLRMAVRHDRPGILRQDYQTAGCHAGDRIIKADQSLEKKDGVVSYRRYLADACFVAGLEGRDGALLQKVHQSLQSPHWPIFLGRKSYVPSKPVFFSSGPSELSLLDTMRTCPWIGETNRTRAAPEQLLVSLESDTKEGILRMDQPLSNFSERRFGARYVQSVWINTPSEGNNVSN